MNQHGRLSTGCAILLAIAAFVLFLLWMRGCWVSPWVNGHGWQGLFGFSDIPFFGRPFGLIGIWGLIQIALAFWVGVDADRRGQNGWLWGLLVFFTGIVGLLVYLLVVTTMGQKIPAPTTPQRPATAAVAPSTAPTRSCPNCQARVQEEFKACPLCGHTLRCGNCDKPVEAAWKLCPYCTTPLGSA